MAPDQNDVDRLLNIECERTIHVFSGIIRNPALNATFRRALSSRAIVGVLSEGRDWRGLWGALRYAHSLFHEHRYSKKVDFVLAIGRVGTKWFSKCGYDPAKLFPFCYVVEKYGREDARCSVNGAVTITAVGSLIPLKRVDLLIEALANVSSRAWDLVIIGDGKQRRSLEAMSVRLGLREKIRFMGGMPNRKVRQELDRCDIFVFTSRYDGWGAVVNEALMSGAPVICSDYPGAADLVVPGLNGELFECDSLASLSRVLDKWISNGPLAIPEREKIQAWSCCIEGEAVARYFIRIVDYLEDGSLARPKAPWLSQ
jgi:glycosyltransferase involved in cell wall biosynthesis